MARRKVESEKGGFLKSHWGKLLVLLLMVAIVVGVGVACWKIKEAMPAITKFVAFGIKPFGFLAGIGTAKGAFAFGGICAGAFGVVSALGFGLWKAGSWGYRKLCGPEVESRDHLSETIREGDSRDRRTHGHRHGHAPHHPRGPTMFPPGAPAATDPLLTHDPSHTGTHFPST